MVTTRQANGNSSLEIAQSNQELVTKERNHRRRTWLILGLIVVIALVVVVAAIVIMSGSNNDKPESSPLLNSPAITLEDFLEGRLVPRAFNATWISGNELLYRDAAENIVLYNTKTREVKKLLPVEMIPLSAFEHELSPDQKFLLIGHNYQKLYSRYSFLAQYTIVDLQTLAKQPLTANEGKDKVLQLALWVPGGNGLIYIFNNDIYYRPSVGSKEEIRLTNEGEIERIYHGRPDWVYEEEVLGSNKALWISPSGKKLAYMKINDTQVGIMNLPVYGQPENPRFQYTQNIPIRYPKAGTPNPEVELLLVDLDSAKNFRQLPITQQLYKPTNLGSEPVLSAVAWPNDENVCAIWLNRIQNKAEIVSCDFLSANCETIMNVQSLDGWLEMFTPPIFSKDGSKMLLIMSHDQGNGAGAFRHVTLIEYKPNGKIIPVTKGKFVVTDILSWDETQQLVYFLGTTEKDPGAQHLYTVSTSKIESNNNEIRCISCKVKSAHNNKTCLYNGAVFSSDSSHYTLNCAGPGVPEIALYDDKHKKIETWEHNEEILELVEDKLTPSFEKLEIEVDGGFKAQVLLQLPPNMDRTGNVKYPMIVNVYGGPDSYAVVDKFSLNWFSYLASNKSIIVAAIDGRGSGLKGDKMLFAGYGKLGTVEIVDQINVTSILQRKLPYVDEKRTAIWGWSYGGYASGLALAKDTNNVFKCAISIAPVTDWTLYDSIYTERFMGVPKGDRVEAYRQASLLNKVENIRNKMYLLIHGTLDDNVHYQQSMLLAKELELKDIQFRQQSYPDEDHGLASVRKHLYHTFENFLDDCFAANPES